jgi:hypothetical protein
LRIGALLKRKVSDISDGTITLREPKSGKESELACMPENVSKKPAEYVRDKDLQSDDRPLPICCSTARTLVRRLVETVNVRISPHDLPDILGYLCRQKWCAAGSRVKSDLEASGFED